MTTLAKGWALAEIAEVLELNSNGKPFQQGWSPLCEPKPAADDCWGVLKTTAIQPGEFRPHENKRLPEHLEPRSNIEVKPGDVLMTCAGPRSRCGVVCLVESTRASLMLSGKMYRFRPHPEAIASKYLAYFIQSRDAQLAIDRMKTGISDSGLNLTHDRFAKLVVPVPPLNEQRRIVAKIEELFSELDKGVESLKTAQQQLKAYRQAVLKHAFEGKLTADWRATKSRAPESAQTLLAKIKADRAARFEKSLDEWRVALRNWTPDSGPKPAKPREAKDNINHRDEIRPVVPVDWRWTMVGEFADLITDGTHHTPTYTSSGVPFISVKDIFEGQVSFDDCKFVSQDEHAVLAQRCNPEPGDLLITKSGTIGRLAIVPDAVFSLFVSVALVKIQSAKSHVLPRWLSYVFEHHIMSLDINRDIKGGLLKNYHLEDLRVAQLPLCGTEEQGAIVAALDEKLALADSLANLIGQADNRAAGLRQAILKAAFSGQLVPQDPTDEPASVLLGRIQADRANAVGNKKKKDRAA